MITTTATIIITIIIIVDYEIVLLVVVALRPGRGFSARRNPVSGRDRTQRREIRTDNHNYDKKNKANNT